MSGKRTAPWLRYLRFFGPDARADVDDELRFHLELRTRDLVAAGLTPAAAHAEAVRQFGDALSIRDACLTIDERRRRRADRHERMGDLMLDLRLAFRALRHSPAFTLMAVACIALGVAVTTTIFSAVNSILIRPLPYPNADQLVAVYSRYAARNIYGSNISYPDYVSWRDENRTFAQLGMYNWTSYTLSDATDAERLQGAAVTANLFPLLGVSPLLGRGFSASEQQSGRDHVMMLSYGIWQRRFGGARDIVGRAITVDGVPYTVVGVMPPNFNFPDRGQVWTPLVQEGWMFGRDNRGLAGAIGRLKPGVTLGQAQSDLDVVSRRLQATYRAENFGWDAQALSLRDDLVGDLRRPLLVFQGAVALVLLIACANVANLMLARGAARRRDLAIHVALGAGRGRIARQMLTECMVLAVAGGALGTVLSVFGVRLLRLAFPNDVPFYISLGVDHIALAFAAGVSIITGLAFGLAPALLASRVDPSAWLRDGARGDTAGRPSRVRNALVVGEVALSLVLLVGAMLLIRSYRAFTGTDLGFDEGNLLTARLSLPAAKYDAADKRRAYYETLFARLAALPGVKSVGSAAGIPFSGWNVQAYFSIEGQPVRQHGQELDVHYQHISPGYLSSIGVPIVRGRGFTAADRDSSAHIGIINEVLAREFAGQNPLGKRLRVGGPESTEPWITVVGVARTFRHYQLPQPMGPAIYFPALASPPFSQTLTIRTSGIDPLSLTPSVLRILHELDPDVPAYQVQTMEQVVSRSLWRQRLQGQVLGTFAGLALLLAVVGIYGVISYVVVQRTRELGVRMALGASRGSVLTMVMSQGARLAVIGVAIGLAVALLLTRLLAGLLYGVAATDPATFVTVPVVLTGVAVLASWIPARRATRVDPLVAMRAE